MMNDASRLRTGARATDAHAQHVSAGLLQDAADARDVLGGVQEHRQVHRAFAHAVVVHQVLLEPRHHRGHVRELVVQTVPARGVRLLVPEPVPVHAVPQLLGVHRPVAVHVEVHEELVEVHGEVRRRELGDVLQEPRAVLVRHEPVVEHAHALVHPQTEVLADAAQTGVQPDSLLQGHALDDPRDVAQVEGVVRFGGRRQELLDRRGVHVQRGFDDDVFFGRHLVARTRRCRRTTPGWCRRCVRAPRYRNPRWKAGCSAAGTAA